LWAAKAEEAGADLIMIRLTGLNPNGQPYPAQEAATIVQRVLEATGLPLIVRGPGQPERDNELLTAVADKSAGERIALGLCEDKNYRTIVAAALANNHLVIASTPIDVNLAKQLNILISDMNMPLDRVLMDPTTGALGYGLEYTYSVMERLRIAALQGDPMVQLPMICFSGEESWRQKESKVGEGVPEAWGDWERRAILWEAITATTLLHAGADIVTLRHPKTIALVKQEIQKLMNKP
jgi:acetyl-CoA decarbonylase/synthase complex subunit delta